MEERFANRQDAGRLLKEAILASVGSTGCADVLVLGLRAGGVPVAFEVARALAAPLDVFVVRKLELPGGDGVVMGHIAAGGVRVLDGALISARKIPAETIEEVARAEAVELARLERYYRGRRVAPKMMGRTIVLVDDGLSSASTLRAAVGALGMYRPKRIVLAAPVMDPGVYEEMREAAGEVVTAMAPDPVGETGSYYEEGPLSEREVRQWLSRAADFHAATSALSAAS